jgi:hypothetical protein
MGESMRARNFVLIACWGSGSILCKHSAVFAGPLLSS